MRGRAVMAGCLVIALVTMLVFDSAVTRIVGVAALFGFIVSGVFVIAHPDFLDGGEEEALPRPHRRVPRG
jgi:hypothetical protein